MKEMNTYLEKRMNKAVSKLRYHESLWPMRQEFSQGGLRGVFGKTCKLAIFNL